MRLRMIKFLFQLETISTLYEEHLTIEVDRIPISNGNAATGIKR